ncbi:MAG: hypothetical protein V1796_09195 [Pseudomonadota bacterium]
MSQQINLFDPGLRSRRSPLTAGTMAVAIAVLMAGMLGVHQVAKRDLARAEALRNNADSRVIELRAQLASAGSQSRRDADKALLDEIARVETRVKGWQELLERLRGAGIGNTEGHAGFLEALAREHADGVWLTGVAIGGAAGGFSIQGRVLRPELLPGYIQLLSGEEALRGRRIGDMKIIQPRQDPSKTGPASVGAAPKPGSEPSPPELRRQDYVEFSIGTDATADAGG